MKQSCYFVRNVVSRPLEYMAKVWCLLISGAARAVSSPFSLIAPSAEEKACKEILSLVGTVIVFDRVLSESKMGILTLM